jgi:hypothetical protein
MKLSPNDIEQLLMKAKKEHLNAFQAQVVQYELTKWNVKPIEKK